MSTYVVRPGSGAARVIEYLQSVGSAKAADLCDGAGIDPRSLAALIRSAVLAGLILRTGKGCAVLYSLPGPVAEDPPPVFNAALWADGELSIYGGQPSGDQGAIVLSADQVAKLRGLLLGL
jgi:hypothetical protein